MIVNRLRTVSWSNDCHPTGEVKPVNGIQTLPLTSKVLYSIALLAEISICIVSKESDIKKIL